MKGTGPRGFALIEALAALCIAAVGAAATIRLTAAISNSLRARRLEASTLDSGRLRCTAVRDAAHHLCRSSNAREDAITILREHRGFAP